MFTCTITCSSKSRRLYAFHDGHEISWYTIASPVADLNWGVSCAFDCTTAELTSTLSYGSGERTSTGLILYNPICHRYRCMIPVKYHDSVASWASHFVHLSKVIPLLGVKRNILRRSFEASADLCQCGTHRVATFNLQIFVSPLAQGSLEKCM